MLLALSSSYCYSDISYGVTNNAAIAGLSWGMQQILPDYSAPYVTVQIHGLTYRYKMVKDPETDALVYIRNKNAVDGGYIFEETDDWSGNPGGTIQKYIRFPYSDATKWGDGSMSVEGEGRIENPLAIYNYKLDVDEQAMLCYGNPLYDSSCPGFQQALLDYLNNMETLSPDDPFYDEWVQANLSLNDEKGNEEVKEIKEPEEKLSKFEKKLGGENSIGDLVNGAEQGRVLAALAQNQKIENYYAVVIPGGEYTDELILEDATLPDNPRAMKSLASDTKHNTMVRSQYD